LHKHRVGAAGVEKRRGGENLGVVG